MRWLHYRVRVFNFGNYRRKYLGAHKTADFYDPFNEENTRAREKMAKAGIQDMLDYLKGEKTRGQIGILDATNTTPSRRKYIRQTIVHEHGYELLFIESVCEDKAVLEKSIREVKAKHPDYTGVDRDAAVKDFHNRIAQYKKAYVKVQEDEGSFIRLQDAGRAVYLHRVSGALQSKLAAYLMNLRPLNSVPLFLTRHGCSGFNEIARIGGDSELSADGRQFSVALGRWIASQPRFRESSEKGETTVDRWDDDRRERQIWHSPMVRARQTAEIVRDQLREVDHDAQATPRLVEHRALREIDAGICDSMTYMEIKERFPFEFASRAKNKLTYRYPNGESYLDVIHRVEPVILELERSNGPILIVAHRALLRCLLAYFLDTPLVEVPHKKLPLHHVFELKHTRTGVCSETVHDMSEISSALDIKGVEENGEEEDAGKKRASPSSMARRSRAVPIDPRQGQSRARSGTPFGDFEESFG